MLKNIRLKSSSQLLPRNGSTLLRISTVFFSAAPEIVTIDETHANRQRDPLSIQNEAPRRVTAKWYGRRSYQEGMELQKKYMAKHLHFIQSQKSNADFKKSKNSIGNRNHLILLEHEPVYTVGLRTQSYSETEEERLRQLGADFVRTDRGGLITFHGPGQLVAYPILDLASFAGTGKIRWYVSQLEQCLIRACGEWGVRGALSPECHTGVWVGDPGRERKVGAIGIHVTQKRITSHGVALNGNPDLTWFSHVVPCGLEGKEVTSLSEELGRDIKTQDMIIPFCKSFSQQFQCPIDLKI